MHTRMDTLRRRLLQIAVAVVPAHALSACSTSAPSDPTAAQPGDALGRRRFFADSEWKLVDSAVARLIPADTLGPGAREANVALFIDWQLAGPFGRAETWYMHGPWKDGTEQQGYQSKYAPAQLYRTAIKDRRRPLRRLPSAARSSRSSTPTRRTRCSTASKRTRSSLPTRRPRRGSTMLLQNTVEGFLADPMYGGNRDFIGWKLIGFPGPRYDYADEIEQYNKRYTLPPVGILGRDGRRLMRDES